LPKEKGKKRILGAALGNCIHVAGIINFLSLAEQEGYDTVFLSPKIAISELVQEIKRLNPDIVAVSYRLTPQNARALFGELKDAIRRHGLESQKFILGGTAPVAAVGREAGIFEAVFSGVEPREEIINYLRGITGKVKSAVKHSETLPDAIDSRYPVPLIRHHLGLPSMKETIDAAREIAQAGILDILSIAPDQNAQEYFFHQQEMDDSLSGSGGVPVRKPEDLAAIYNATRCGNYPLVRCYAGTRDLTKWAKMLKETINVAWGAVPLSWYSQLDDRSKRTVPAALKENIAAIRWYARHNIPVEVNESHQWALRNTSDIIEVATAFLASYVAKKSGVRWYVMQYMLNTPAEISPQMDLAKMLAKIELIEKLQDKDFTCYRMVRTGLTSLSANPNIAKGQLASSVTISMSLKPHIVHVVGYSEGEHAATAPVIIESCEIARGVIDRCLKGLPDMHSDRAVQNRKKKLVAQATLLLEAIKQLADDKVDDPWTDPATLAAAIRTGLLDAPHLRGNAFARGRLETGVIDGACQAIDAGTRSVLPEKDRIAKILSEYHGRK